MPVFFITDLLLFLLLLLLSGFAFYANKHQHLSEPWKAVARNPVAMRAAVVLFVYALIGLLDSVHFRPTLENINHQEAHNTVAEKYYSTEILSLLDVLFSSLRNNNEKTYSAPFATHHYTKEFVELADGTKFYEYPRLNHGGAHLAEPEKGKTADILFKSLTGLMYGLIIWFLASGMIIVAVKYRSGLSFSESLYRLFKKNSAVPWLSIHNTLGVVLILLVMFTYLSNYYHVLGTDKVGQDVLYQSLKSIRTGLVIGTLTTLIMLPFALFMGLVAGYYHGWADDMIQYLYTTLNSIPSVLLIAAAILILQVHMANHAQDFASLGHRADMRLFFICVILGITSWTGLCRLLRGEALKIRESDYVQAARALGVRHFTIITTHLLPNIMHIVIISIALDFSALVLAEAILSYINIGVDPSMHSWGNMINSARLEIAREPVIWWPLIAAFIFMFILVLAANLFSDAVRDAFDPRLSGS